MGRYKNRHESLSAVSVCIESILKINNLSNQAPLIFKIFKNIKRMAIYIVTYDLKGETISERYNRLIELIKEEGVWACLGGSTYLIESVRTPVELRDRYNTVLNRDDMLYVSQVSAPAAWRGYSQQVTDWIKEKM